MCLRSPVIYLIPEDTQRVAHAAFPKGNVYMCIRDELGPIYQNQAFAELFSRRGQPAEAPARLALVTIMQFAEGLSDRQAADAVRSRIDWKYALSLELTDPGFDSSVLSEFRSRLLTGNVEQLLFEALLTQLQEKNLLKARGRVRTDSTHILAAIRTLNRLEMVGETLRQALNTLATVAPEWLRAWVPPDWFDRYRRRFEEYRLPPGREERYALAAQIGRDGAQLLEAIYAPAAPDWLRQVPAVQTLRQVWVQQFVVLEDQFQWRTAEDLPPSTLLIQSPYDAEARYAKKRQTEWTGYKVHITETCDPDLPHLITNIETTPAPVTDYELTAVIHSHLGARDRLPGEHLVDSGYLSAEQLVRSREQGIELVGPVTAEKSWQAQANEGFDIAAFTIDWEAQQARCLQGHLSQKWTTDTRRSTPLIHFRFSRTACRACPVRAQCTRSENLPRSLTIYPQPFFGALQAARARQQTAAFRQQYAARAGVEGTIAQGNAIADWRRARFIGLAKTHLQHLCTALGMNLLRLGEWFMEGKPHTTHKSAFAALVPA